MSEFFVWNNETGSWEPHHRFPNSDPREMPLPKYRVGDVVRFRWSKPSTLTGRIEAIDGHIIEQPILKRKKRGIMYFVRAGGHIRLVDEEKVMSRRY